MEIWKILNIAKTNDITEIKKAYQKALKTCHPEEKTEEFVRLQKAYRDALNEAKGKLQSHEELTEENNNADGEDEEGRDDELLRKLEEEEKKLEKIRKNTRAISKFIRLFEDDVTVENRDSWRDFFNSEMFWKEMRDEVFLKTILEYLEKQDKYAFELLPKELVSEMAICYAPFLAHNDREVRFRDDAKEPKSFKYVCYKIWSANKYLVENTDYLLKRSNVTRRRAYWCFHELFEKIEYNNWSSVKYGKPGKPDYIYTLSMGRDCFPMTDEEAEKSKMDIYDLEDDHINIIFLRMVNFLLRNYDIPIDVCSYIYKEYKLNAIDKHPLAKLYLPIKEYLLENYPKIETYTAKKQLTADEYADQLIEQLEKINREYFDKGWGRHHSGYHRTYALCNYDGEEEDYLRTKALFQTPEFQRFKYSENVISELYSFKATKMEADAILEEYTKESFWDKPSVTRVILEAFRNRLEALRMPEYICGSDYEYDLNIGNREFWYYYVAIAFGDRLTKVENSQTPPIAPRFMIGQFLSMYSLINNVTKPSMEWVQRFTGYNINKGTFENSSVMNIRIDEDNVFTIEPHIHYVRFYLNDEEIFEPVMSLTELNDIFSEVENTVAFMLLLPVCYIEGENVDEDEKKRIQMCAGRIFNVLSELFDNEIMGDYLTRQILNNNAFSYVVDNIVSRKYIENLDTCYRLDINTDGDRFLWKFNHSIGIFEDMDAENVEEHYRPFSMFRGDDEDDADKGYNMDTFEERQISLTYVLDKEIIDISGLSVEEKVKYIMEMSENNNEFVLAYAGPERSSLRFRFYMHDITAPEKLEDELGKIKYLNQYYDRLKLLMDGEYNKLYSIGLGEELNDCVMGQDKNGNWLAKFTHDDEADEKTTSLAEMVGKLIEVENVSYIILVEEEERSEWR